MSADSDTESKVVDAIYRGARYDFDLRDAADAIASLFDSPSLLLGEIDFTDNTVSVVGSGLMDEAQRARYVAHAHLDPAPRAFAAMPVCSATTTDRLFSQRFRAKSIFVNEYLKPIGIDQCLAGPLAIEGDRMAAIAIHEGRHRRTFDVADIAMLERLAPHLARALQLRRAFGDLAREKEAYEAIVDSRENGMIGVRSDGSALFVNRAALAVAASSDGLALDRGGRPVFADRAANLRLAKLQADVRTGGSGGIIRVERPSGRAAYLVSVSRLPADRDTTPATERGTLFLIHDPARRRRSSERLISDALRMPTGAARVVAALLAGESLIAYSERAGLTMNTVRCHLKHAYALTDTHSQADLVRLALTTLNAVAP